MECTISVLYTGVGLVTVHDIALCGLGLIIGVQDVMG